jgi:hypothetical protein
MQFSLDNKTFRTISLIQSCKELFISKNNNTIAIINNIIMNTIEYIKPEIEIIEIGLENVIATSKELNDDHNGWAGAPKRKNFWKDED